MFISSSSTNAILLEYDNIQQEQNNLLYYYVGNDLYVVDNANNVVSINGIDYEAVQSIQINEHPLSIMAYSLKDQIEIQLIPGLVNLLYYIHNKNVSDYRKQHNIASNNVQDQYIAAYKPINLLLDNMSTNMFRAIPISNERIMLCTEIYATNASNVYAIDVADTILNGYIDAKTITYNTNDNTVTLNL